MDTQRHWSIKQKMKNFDALPKEARDWINYYEGPAAFFSLSLYALERASSLGGEALVISVVNELKKYKEVST